MRALIDDKLSPIKTMAVPAESPFASEESPFQFKMQPMATTPVKINSDIDDLLTIDNFKEQHSPVKLNAPTYYPMKTVEEEESFEGDFPIPKKSPVPLSNYKKTYQNQIKGLLEERVNRALVDPLIEDVKKEATRIRETTVYKDLVDQRKDLMEQARLAAADIVKDYPEDTNTYGKRKLAMIQILQESKLKGGMRHEEYRRTDSLTPALPVDARVLRQDTEEEVPQEEPEKVREGPKVKYNPPRGMGSVRGTARLGRQF